MVRTRRAEGNVREKAGKKKDGKRKSVQQKEDKLVRRPSSRHLKRHGLDRLYCRGYYQ